MEYIYLDHITLRWKLGIAVATQADGYKHLCLYVEDERYAYLIAEIWHVTEDNFLFAVQCLLDEIA